MRHVRPAQTPAVVVVVVVVVAALVAACGGSAGKSAAPSTSAAPPTSAVTTATTTAVTTAVTAPTTTAVNTAALTAKAAAALFQASDFPPAFKAQNDGMGTCPNTAASCASLNIENVWSDLMTCLGVADMPEAKAVSPTYLEGIATQARVTVEYTTPASANAIRSALQGSRYDPCMTTAFTTDAKKVAQQVGSTPSPTTVSALTTAPSVTGLVSASRIRVDMNLGGGLIINIYQDFLVVINGGTVIRFFFLNPGGPFLTTLETPLITKVVSLAGS